MTLVFGESHVWIGGVILELVTTLDAPQDQARDLEQGASSRPMKINDVRRTDKTVQRWFGEVSAAAQAFEARWTRLSLARVDAELAQRLMEQRKLFDQACVTGTPDEVEEHGAAMCRGYAAAMAAMEQAEQADSAYMIGIDTTSGLKVAIGQQRAAAARVVELHGSSTVWVTPDEVAAMIALAPFNGIKDIKQVFPGAEIIEFRKTDEEGN
jgi:hypothetical protein